MITTIDTPSPNFSQRPEGVMPDMIVIHYTDMPTAFDALTHLQKPESQVSAHYLIDEEGQVYKIVEEENRAWHAGVSYWDKRENINDHSIGIELANPGHSNGYVPFPAPQMKALSKLCKDIIRRRGILPHNIVGHSCIAPGRKQDPGHLFDWKWLADQGVGCWPALQGAVGRSTERLETLQGAVGRSTERLEKESKDYLNSDKIEERDLLRLFVKYGYHPELPFEDLMEAFARRFQPEKIEQDKTEPDQETFDILNALIRSKLNSRKRS